MSDTVGIISSTEFGKLFSEYKPRFVAFAYRYVRDANTAEDLVADSFMAFWEAKDKLTAEVNIPAYILAIVRNRCLNHLSAELRHLKAEKKIHTTQQRLLEADLRSLSVCDPDKLFSEEINLILERAVGQMPEMTRKVFMGSRFDGKSYKEISEELGIAITHVNFEIRRALNILRIEFKDYLTAFIIALLLFPRF